MDRIRLGLIGDNIAASRSPALQRACGVLTGIEVSYDLFIPPLMGLDFAAVLDACRADGLAGVNVTLPYKERVVAHLAVADRSVAHVGACNTVRFVQAGATGSNTDHSGFIATYRAAFADAPPGRVVLLGAGGVGRAIAFALVTLGAAALVIVDTAADKAAALAAAVNAAADRAVATTGGLEALEEADGVVNATPLGMVGYGGSPVPADAFPRARWAFDAVYTPVDTRFSQQAVAAGAAFVSGYELYIHQGIDAFEIWTGRRPPLPALRAMLAETEGLRASRSA